MMLIAIFTLISLFGTIAIGAQNFELTGTLTDSLTGEALIGASVSDPLGDTGTVTDVTGRYALSLSSGWHTIEFSYLGYETISRDVMMNDNIVIDAQLGESSTILETTTITGSRYEKSLAKSVVSINVIKPQLIDNNNINIIDKLLDKIPGVQMIDGQANIRGGSGFSYGAGSRVLLLIDDVPAFQADAGRPLWDDIPVENISQIEVLKGASSALYGSAALNGIINIRTGYATAEPQTKAYTSYTYFMDPQDDRKKWWGTDETIAAPYIVNVGLSHKQKFGKLDVVASAFAEKFERYVENSFKNRIRASTNLKYRLSDRVTISANMMYNYKKDDNFFIWENASTGTYKGSAGTSTGGVTNRFYIDPQVTVFDKRNNKHRFIGRYFYINNGSLGTQATASNNIYGEYQYTGRVSELDLDYTAGTSTYFLQSESQLFGDVNVTGYNSAIFGQFDKGFFNDKLELTIGARLELNQLDIPDIYQLDTLAVESESKFVKRLGLNYEALSFVNLRFSYGEGYRFPTIAEKYIQTNLGGISVLPNPELQSESGWTSEFGIKSLFRVGTWEGYVDLAAFRSEYEDMMEFTFLDNGGSLGFQSINIGNTTINGFEVNLVGRSKLGDFPINLLAGLTVIRPRYSDFDNNVTIQNSISKPIDENENPNFLKYRSKRNFKIDAEIEINKLTLGTAFNISSAIVTIDQFLFNFAQIGIYKEINPGGFSRWDARASYDFDIIKVSVLSNNLLNGEYSIRPGTLEPPRSIAVRLDKVF